MLQLEGEKNLKKNKKVQIMCGNRSMLLESTKIKSFSCLNIMLVNCALSTDVSCQRVVAL